MANIKKIQKAQIYNLLKHNNRTKDDGVQHSNENIDKELSPNNYHFKKGDYNKYKELISNHYCLDRDNQINVVDIVVTLPQDVKEEDEYTFFQSVYNFYCDDFGEQNIVNAVVHKDEVTPHIHLDIIPVEKINKDEISDCLKKRIAMWEQKNNKECETVVCCKHIVTRAYLQTMHTRLLDYVKKDLGYTCEILNGATENGNKTVLQLKNGLLEDELKDKQEQLGILNKNITFVLKSIDEVGVDKRYFDIQDILNKLSLYRQECNIYKEAMLSHGINKIALPESYLEELRKSKLLGSNFTVRDGILIPNDLTTTLIEVPKEIKRPYPTYRLLRNDSNLKAWIENNTVKDLTTIQSKGKKYMVFPTDNEEDTFRNLLRLKNRSDIDKLAMTEISNDTFHLAETILRTCDFEVEYYLLKAEADNERQREREIMRTLGIE